MTTANSESKVSEKTSELAKNIWLAGLGAYGKAYDQAQGRYEKASRESSRFFEDLVSKGQKLEGSTQKKLTVVKNKSTETLEERITNVKEALGFGETGKKATLSDLEAKIEKLSAKIDKLSALTAKKPK